MKRVGQPLIASSEAVFGSAARGDADRLSDRDILIVDDNPDVLRVRTSTLEAQGWSVASYTFNKLEGLAAKGALFVQHLKLESEILDDRRGRLRRILRSYRPKLNYGQELAENAKLAALASNVPSGRGGVLLAADILYVAVRNFGVLRLAERGIHTYSYNSILEGLKSERLIREQAAESLAALRFLKCLYRSGERTHGEHTLDVLNRSLSNLPETYFPALIQPTHPIAVIHRAPPAAASSAYLFLRDLEVRLVALEAIQSKSVAGRDLDDLKRWIANPRAYVALSASVAPRLRSAIERKCSELVGLPQMQRAVRYGR